MIGLRVVLALLLLAGCGAPATAPRTGPDDGDSTTLNAAGPDAGCDLDAATLEAPDPGGPETFPHPDHLDIELEGAGTLKLVEYLMKGEKRGQGVTYLVGKIGVTVSNPSDIAVRLVHMEPANLVFTSEETGEHFSMLHPCDPGLLLGSVIEADHWSEEDEARVMANSVFTLEPGQSRKFEMGDDWGCSGGPWRPVPAPGKYSLEYRIHRLEPGWKPAVDPEKGGSMHQRIEAVRAALSGDEFWEGAYRSESVEIVLERPTVKRLAY